MNKDKYIVWGVFNNCGHNGPTCIHTPACGAQNTPSDPKLNQYMVINSQTKRVHSSWSSLIAARKAAYDLNRIETFKWHA